MSLLELGPVHVERVIQKVREREPRARRIGIQHAGRWTGGDTIRAGADEFRVVVCPSPLAVREALVEAGDRPVVVLTPSDPSALGLDVMARFASRRLQSVERFEALKNLFGAVKSDPRLGSLKWLADDVLASPPAGGYPVPGNGYLDVDRVWQAFFERRLGIESAKPDVRALLKACVENTAIVDWKSWRADVREGTAARIAEGAGEVGKLILASLEAERPVHPVAIGLVCRVLIDKASGADELELKQALARLEPALGGHVVTETQAEEWAREAEAIVQTMPNASRQVQSAQQLLGDLKVAHHAWRSNLIPAGFERRVSRFAQQIQRALDGSGNLDSLMEASRQIALHNSSRGTGERRRRAAEMATRLVRWLATPAVTALPSFHAAVEAYAHDLSFVDRAREEMAVGESNSDAAKAYARLAEACVTRREEWSRLFAEKLVAWSEHPGDGAGLVKIERVLADIVAPLAAERAVLLLVMDGMSYAVFRQLLDDTTAIGWMELAKDREGKRLSAVAVLPSQTEISRTSLLCGALRAGLAADEKAGFAAHDALRAASRGKASPVLFHKAGLAEGGGYGLPDDLAAAISPKGPRVVGLVVNAVDDHLAKGEQSAPRWGVDAITPLRAVLESALSAERLLVVTADHGHVVERGTEMRASEDGERHRRPSGKLEPGEVLVKGPRVVFEGGAVVLPWSEKLRYARKKNGYHGGASPQEVVVPLAVFAPGDVAIAGWSELVPEAPDWWDLEAAPAARRLVKSSARGAQTDLFAAPPPNLVDQLRASERWKDQLAQAGRIRPSDEDLRTVVEALVASQGTLTIAALSRKLAVPASRLESKLNAVRKVLNVEGYAVFEYDERAQTVRLDEALLREQFALGS